MDSPKVKETKENRLPLARIKAIMRGCPEIDLISNDSVIIMAKATELFVNYLTTSAYKTSNQAKEFQYKHLSDLIKTDEILEYLSEIIPAKITVKAAKEHQMKLDNSSDEDTDEEEESGEEEESEDSEEEEKSAEETIEISD